MEEEESPYSVATLKRVWSFAKWKDENFILKHDRAFLLSMANRGKDTNGSQFFITTKTAPHLDGVHVVFGLVISGFEVIKRIESLKTDSASRPYADVRVIDCGQLITKSANDVLEGKKRKAFYSEDDSASSSDSQTSFESGEESNRNFTPRKKRNASKHPKRRRREGGRKEKRCEKTTNKGSPAEQDMAEEEDGGKEQNVKREKPVVRPEEIPPVPENRFLLRRDMPTQEGIADGTEQETATAPGDPKPAVTKSGRKLKGRGTMRYHTPPLEKSRSESEEERGSSETPPHWKEEMQRTKNYQPPSVEKWSKEEWNDRSDTPWSRSRSRSRLRTRSRSREHSSDQTSDHSIKRHRHRKEKKKAKRKKKAKKRKHSKKHKKNKLKDASPSEDEKSVSSSKRSRPSSYPGRRSHSRSRSFSTSHHSHRTNESGSNRRRSSSHSSRDSRSYSRSRGRSYSRSRSRSDSKFRSTSRSRSRSRSGRSITTSRSRSRSSSSFRTKSRSRSRSRYRSQSPRYRKRSRSPKRTKLNEGSMKKVSNPIPNTTQGKTPPTSSEGVSVLPLSDSPPPSRWKPGQKPWKPSYVRVEETKTKTGLPSRDLVGRTPGTNLEREAQPVFHSKLEKPTSQRDPNSSRLYSANSKKTDSLLRRGSSRSQSSSRSRSRNRSRSRSVSPGLNNRSSYSSSSSTRSDSYDSYRKFTSDMRGKQHHGHYQKKQKRTKNAIQIHPKQDASPFHSIDGTESSINHPRPRHNSSEVQEKKPEHLSERAKNFSQNKTLLVGVVNSKPGSGWESDSDNLSKQASGGKPSTIQIPLNHQGELSENQKKEILARCWESESETEMPESSTAIGETKCLSDKEEGEASSESESDDAAIMFHKLRQVSRVPGDLKSSEEHRNENTKHEKHKSKKTKRKHKHRRRNSDRSGSNRSKAKTKKSKKKHQKPKETFHWQPPLEFGEEGEDDDSLAQLKNVDMAQKSAVKDEPPKSDKVTQLNCVSERSSEKAGHDSSTGDHYSRNMMKSQQTKLNTRVEKSQAQNDHPHISLKQSNANAASCSQERLTDQDDMEICTPEHMPETNTEPSGPSVVELSSLTKTASNGNLLLPQRDQKASVNVSSILTHSNQPGEAPSENAGLAGDTKWKPLKGATVVQAFNAVPLVMKINKPQLSTEGKTQGLKIEIKSKSKVRPGSLFDEVRKTARLNQRPRNQDSSSDEDSPSAAEEQAASQRLSRSKSRSTTSPRSRHRGRSHSYSRSRSRSFSYSSRSYSRSRSRRKHSRDRFRSRSSSYRSHTYSRSRSRSWSRGRRKSRSYTYDSYSSRSRSGSRRRHHRRSKSRSRSYRSYSRSSSRHGSRSSRYS
ncbi:NK-tumor recognition protein isoform X2 [Astyanax mexicanus]|uniref:NK-tumor recognition protein isoform X2 n=1 Tax=Astyanax mexicanus TaxID=7994 RepID=UPI0020CB07F8|nr:NK-tumor recognition protein isoform X2 [Astyanax mexicanus]